MAQERSKIKPAFSLAGAFSVGGWSGGRAPTSSGVNTTGAPSSPGVVLADALAEFFSASTGEVVAFVSAGAGEVLCEFMRVSWQPWPDAANDTPAAATTAQLYCRSLRPAR
jgi:hypothetical protein